MSKKTYNLYVQLRKFYVSNRGFTAADLERQQLEFEQQRDDLVKELVAAGLSDGTYTEPPQNIMADHLLVVTDARTAGLIAEKYSSSVIVAKPGGRHYIFEGYRSVPTWLFRDVSAAERALNLERFYARGRLEYLLSGANAPEQITLIEALTTNLNKASTIEQVVKVRERIEFHRQTHPEWSWTGLPPRA